MDAAMILHVLFLILILILGRGLFSLFKVTFLKKPQVLDYKIKSKPFSIFIVVGYIGIFIIFFYVLRLYNINRILDLKLIHFQLSLIYEITSNISSRLKIYLVVIVLLCLLIFFILLLVVHKYARKEALKLFIFYSYNNYFENNIHTKKIFERLCYIGPYNLIKYFLYRVSCKYYDKYKSHVPTSEYHTLSKYSPDIIIQIIIQSSIFKYLINFSPLLFVIYDCLYNDFVISHVYYWLLFFIPMKMLQRITTVCGSSSETMMALLWEIYYKEESCIYAINEKIQGFLDSYLHSGVRKNFEVNLEAEFYFKHYIRFVCVADPMYKAPFELPSNWDGNKRDPEKRIFVNEESVLLYRNKENRLIEMVHSEREEDLGKMFWGQEWILLVDKMDKGFIKSEPSYTAELNNVYRALRY